MDIASSQSDTGIYTRLCWCNQEPIDSNTRAFQRMMQCLQNIDSPSQHNGRKKTKGSTLFQRWRRSGLWETKRDIFLLSRDLRVDRRRFVLHYNFLSTPMFSYFFLNSMYSSCLPLEKIWPSSENFQRTINRAIYCPRWLCWFALCEQMSPTLFEQTRNSQHCIKLARWRIPWSLSERQR